jgi:hypothetical protein
MPKVDDARDGAEAVRKFATEVGRGGRRAERVQATFGGAHGMATLCEVEAVLSDLWPSTIAKELVWLGRSAMEGDDRLHLQAFAANGEVLCKATFHLEPRHV